MKVKDLLRVVYGDVYISIAYINCSDKIIYSKKPNDFGYSWINELVIWHVVPVSSSEIKVVCMEGAR